MWSGSLVPGGVLLPPTVDTRPRRRHGVPRDNPFVPAPGRRSIGPIDTAIDANWFAIRNVFVPPCVGFAATATVRIDDP